MVTSASSLKWGLLAVTPISQRESEAQREEVPSQGLMNSLLQSLLSVEEWPQGVGERL